MNLLIRLRYQLDIPSLGTYAASNGCTVAYYLGFAPRLGGKRTVLLLFFESRIEVKNFILTWSRLRPRLISTSQLQALLLFHTWPINQIISLESYQLSLWEISS
jgi:hypothetical protein